MKSAASIVVRTYTAWARLYTSFSGSPPFAQESVVDVILKVLNEEVRPPRELLMDLPVALDTIIFVWRLAALQGACG